MDVYIEYAICDNLIMDYLLLKATCRLLKVKADIYRLIVASVIGTVIALIVPLFSLTSGISFLIKIILGMLVALLGARHKSLFNYFKFFNVFLVITFMLGGAIIGVLSLLNIDYSNGISGGVLPVGVNFLVAYLAFKLIRSVTEKIVDRLERDFYLDVEITACQKRIKLKGFIDSGNSLVDAKTGLRVIVCTKSVVEQFFGKNSVANRYMPINTASGFGLLALYEIDEVLVHTKQGETFYDGILGVSSEVSFGENIDVLLGASFL